MKWVVVTLALLFLILLSLFISFREGFDSDSEDTVKENSAMIGNTKWWNLSVSPPYLQNFKSK